MAETFFGEIQHIEAVKNQFSPSTRTTINALGTMDPMGSTAIYLSYTIPDEYWVCSGGYTTTSFQLAVMGIDPVGESQLSGYPAQYPSVSMVDYHTGPPTAGETQLHAQALEATDGRKKILLVNKQNQALSVQIPTKQAGIEIVGVTTGGNPWTNEQVQGTIEIPAYAVAVIPRS
ncbi:hypothetical protein PENCOP_c003G04752 [Penicillium coprophilum]|uniref:D-apionate lactonase C-terminal domain-containing protein n=1 Tax=Penicillium coprophilum TaxID=36646 RepID=A0A1V6UZ90_9EURO|nr:hypothetical protein PENCOP_c003G04752 [Penicillium coprophilum]